MAESDQRKKLFDPEGQLIRTCHRILKITTSISLFIEPLFFYVPVINDHDKCLDFNHTLAIVVSVLRSVLDVIFILSLIPRLIILLKPFSIRRRNEIILCFILVFLVGLVPTFPWPQTFFLAPTKFFTQRSSSVVRFAQSFVSSMDSMNMPIFFMLVYRAMLMILIDISGLKSITFWTTTSFPAAASSFYYCMLASHVVGSFWYCLSINSVLRCWRKEWKLDKFFDYDRFFCRYPNRTKVSELNSSCARSHYGIFIGALESSLIESSSSFITKLFYCFWWGLRNLSSFGQNLETSTNLGEIIFATLICICSFVLVTLLLGNIQKIDRYIRKELTATQIEEYNKEMWMARQNVPEYLRERIRQHERYKWENTRIVEAETRIRNLPKYIRRDVKSHLCLALLTKVPQFKTLKDSCLLDALCDKLKPVFYIKETCILREGEPIEEMIFIKRGNLKTRAKNSSNLRDGDFFGEELVAWALDPNSSFHILPISTGTVITISDVEAYALMADDLKFIGPQLHTRLHDEESRTLAASKIRKAWLHHRKSKMERSLLAAEARP